MIYLSEMFLDTFLGCCYTSFKYFKISCMSVSLLVAKLPYWYETNIYIYIYIQFLMRYLSELYWRCFWDISGLFQNYSKFLVCLSFCLSVSCISSNWLFLGVNFWDIWSCLLLEPRAGPKIRYHHFNKTRPDVSEVDPPETQES